jgi:hypothetical protein
MRATVTLTLILWAMTPAAHAQDTGRPRATYRAGACKVTVWDNTKEGEHGEELGRNFHVAKVVRKRGRWEVSQYYTLSELLELRAAIDRAVMEEGIHVESE